MTTDDDPEVDASSDDPGSSPDDTEIDVPDESSGNESVESADDVNGDDRDLRARAERVLTLVLGIALVLSLAGVVYVAMVPPETTDPYTEFYMLNESGNASGYPTQLAPGEAGTVIVGISNHEQQAVEYRMAVTWNGTQSTERTVSVADGETEEFRVDLTAPEEPGHYRVRFLLFNETGGEPYLRNRLWIDVRDPNETGNRSAEENLIISG